MKGLFRIFELTKNEQRVVLVVILALTVGALVQYERRVHRVHVRAPTAPEMKVSPSPVQSEDEQ